MADQNGGIFSEFRSSQLGLIWPHRGQWQCHKMYLVVTTEGALRASRRETSGVLLTILQCTGQPSVVRC